MRTILPDADFIGRSELDLADVGKIRSVIKTHSPDYIVNAAAYTAVDGAESEEKLATDGLAFMKAEHAKRW